MHSTRARIATPLTRFDALVIVAGLMFPGCTATSPDIEQHREKLRSLASTAAAISEAWLDGHVSRRYAEAAFRRTYAMAGHERDDIEASPRTLIDSEGQTLSGASAHLARAVAVLIEGVSHGDADAVRQAAKDLPSIPAESH